MSLLEHARNLRRNMTPQERHIWYDFIRTYPVKVYKQRIIDNYIVDFYCHKARLAIEIDGLQHQSHEGRAYDEERNAVLAKHGIKVLRFDNRYVDDYFHDVCCTIDKEIKGRAYPLTR